MKAETRKSLHISVFLLVLLFHFMVVMEIKGSTNHEEKKEEAQKRKEKTEENRTNV